MAARFRVRDRLAEVREELGADLGVGKRLRHFGLDGPINKESFIFFAPRSKIRFRSKETATWFDILLLFFSHKDMKYP